MWGDEIGRHALLSRGWGVRFKPPCGGSNPSPTAKFFPLLMIVKDELISFPNSILYNYEF